MGCSLAGQKAPKSLAQHSAQTLEDGRAGHGRGEGPVGVSDELSRWGKSFERHLKAEAEAKRTVETYLEAVSQLIGRVAHEGINHPRDIKRHHIEDYMVALQDNDRPGNPHTSLCNHPAILISMTVEGVGGRPTAEQEKAIEARNRLVLLLRLRGDTWADIGALVKLHPRNVAQIWYKAQGTEELDMLREVVTAEVLADLRALSDELHPWVFPSHYPVDEEGKVAFPQVPAQHKDSVDQFFKVIDRRLRILSMRQRDGEPPEVNLAVVNVFGKTESDLAAERIAQVIELLHQKGADRHPPPKVLSPDSVLVRAELAASNGHDPSD